MARLSTQVQQRYAGTELPPKTGCAVSNGVRRSRSSELPGGFQASQVGRQVGTFPGRMADAVWYASGEQKEEISYVREARSTMSRRSPSPTRESFGTVYGDRGLDRLETKRNRQRSPKKGVYHEPPDHRRGPTALDASQLRRGGRAGFTGKDGARVGWHTMHMGTARVVARDKRGHNPVYSRAYPRTTPCGSHTIYSHMQVSHKKGAAADSMRDLEKFESQVLAKTKSSGGHSFRKLCAQDLMDEQDGGNNGDDEREWADEQQLRELILSDQHEAAQQIQKIARGRQGRHRMRKERPQLVAERKEREQARAVKFAEEQKQKLEHRENDS